VTMFPSLRISEILLCICYSILGLENGLLGSVKLEFCGVLRSARVARAVLQLGDMRLALSEMMLGSFQSFLSLRDGEVC